MEARMTGILIVESEALIAWSIGEQLTDWGYHVVGLTTKITTADQLAQRHPPDLILLSIDEYSIDDQVVRFVIFKC